MKTSQLWRKGVWKFRVYHHDHHCVLIRFVRTHTLVLKIWALLSSHCLPWLLWLWLAVSRKLHKFWLYHCDCSHALTLMCQNYVIWSLSLVHSSICRGLFLKTENKPLTSTREVIKSKYHTLGFSWSCYMTVLFQPSESCMVTAIAKHTPHPSYPHP